jgi:hypothetical protein
MLRLLRDHGAEGGLSLHFSLSIPPLPSLFVLYPYTKILDFLPGYGWTGQTVCMHAGYGPIRRCQTTGSMICHLTKSSICFDFFPSFSDRLIFVFLFYIYIYFFVFFWQWISLIGLLALLHRVHLCSSLFGSMLFQMVQYISINTVP